jgi:AAA domain, putative AbiEii toxin, Type IV TA system
MKVQYFTYKSGYEEWELARTDFHPNLNLLVGASGVGKTKILTALMNIIGFGQGTTSSSFGNTSWEIAFDLAEGQHYVWRVKFQKEQSNDILRPLIESETLTIDGISIFERDIKNTFFQGSKLPNLNREESLIVSLKQENLINPIFEAFFTFENDNSISFNSIKEPYQNQSSLLSTYNLLAQIDIYKKQKNLRNAPLDYWYKFAIAYNVDKKSFNHIKEQFINTFPTVTDIKFDAIFPDERWTILFIKEAGVNKWIAQSDMSAGMFKTLNELTKIHFAAPNSLILIDEFENSLGVNCINAVTESIKYDDNDLQFIITSHHPYIINNISVKNWKIVTRDGGLVKTHSADEYGIGQSRLTAFMELQQVEAFLTGSSMQSTL